MLWLWQDNRLDKRFSLDLKDIHEQSGIDYEVIVFDVC